MIPLETGRPRSWRTYESAPPAAAVLARPGCHAGWQRACAVILPKIATATSPSDVREGLTRGVHTRRTISRG
jgi:hypothetical protein